MMYQTKVLSDEYFRIFGGVYNDFRMNCKKDYKFEIDPLNYNDFIEYYKKDLLKCIILLEDDIPTGFLAYSTAPKDTIELYIIHCLGQENIQEKRNCLMEKFMQTIAPLRKDVVVSYPMLGEQSKYREDAEKFGFKFVDLAVVIFDINDKKAIKEIEQIRYTDLPIGYKITSYRDIYFDELVEAIYESFNDSSDTNFDIRFKTIEGCTDIAEKITDSTYGKFLAQSSKVLLLENKLVGFCLSNITGDSIGNIPLVGITPKHRGLGLSKVMLRDTVADIIKLNQTALIRLSELNASVDTANVSAVKMYEEVGFKDSYTYPQAYLPRVEQ